VTNPATRTPNSPASFRHFGRSRQDRPPGRDQGIPTPRVFGKRHRRFNRCSTCLGRPTRSVTERFDDADCPLKVRQIMRILRNLVANWDGNTTVQLQSPFGNPRHDMGALRWSSPSSVSSCFHWADWEVDANIGVGRASKHAE